MPASFLKISGELIQDATLASVEVEQQLNRHWYCRVECRQTRDRRFPAESALGKPFQIITYDEDHAEQVLFDGFVLHSRLRYEIFGNFTVFLTAVTRSYKLDLTPQEAYFRKQPLSDIASALTAQDGLTAEVKCKSRPPKNYVQWGESDFQFLKRLAADHLAWIRPSPSGIQIHDSFQTGIKLPWRTEDGLYTFKVRGSLAQPSFSGTHHNARKMESRSFPNIAKAPEFYNSSGPLVDAVKSQSKAKLPTGFVHIDSRAATAGEYKDLLERESMRALGAHIVACGTSRTEQLLPGDTVDIDGVLDARGTYGVTRVLHRWLPTGYSNEFWCTPCKTFFEPEPPPLAPMRGLVPARVVDHNDPRKMGRIKIQYDWQEQGATGWARMTTPHAGGDRGFMFMPEIGDEVLVAFEHGDPERPFVVGGLWNGVDHAPRDVFWGGDIEPNDIKRIVTKSGHRIQMSDKEGKESIGIATPNELKIGMLEKADETGRSMITMHSVSGDMFFSAPAGRIHFRSHYLSRETGVSGQSPKTAPAPPAPPQLDFSAQSAALTSAAANGIPLCKECMKGK